MNRILSTFIFNFYHISSSKPNYPSIWAILKNGVLLLLGIVAYMKDAVFFVCFFSSNIKQYLLSFPPHETCLLILSQHAFDRSKLSKLLGHSRYPLRSWNFNHLKTILIRYSSLKQTFFSMIYWAYNLSLDIYTYS